MKNATASAKNVATTAQALANAVQNHNQAIVYAQEAAANQKAGTTSKAVASAMKTVTSTGNAVDGAVKAHNEAVANAVAQAGIVQEAIKNAPNVPGVAITSLGTFLGKVADVKNTANTATMTAKNIAQATAGATGSKASATLSKFEGADAEADASTATATMPTNKFWMYAAAIAAIGAFYYIFIREAK